MALSTRSRTLLQQYTYSTCFHQPATYVGTTNLMWLRYFLYSPRTADSPTEATEIHVGWGYTWHVCGQLREILQTWWIQKCPKTSRNCPACVRFHIRVRKPIFCFVRNEEEEYILASKSYILFNFTTSQISTVWWEYIKLMQGWLGSQCVTKQKISALNILVANSSRMLVST